MGWSNKEKDRGFKYLTEDEVNVLLADEKEAIKRELRIEMDYDSIDLDKHEEFIRGDL